MIKLMDFSRVKRMMTFWIKRIDPRWFLLCMDSTLCYSFGFFYYVSFI